MLLLCGSLHTHLYAQVTESSTDKIKTASKKVEKGFEKNNPDTLAQGYFDLGESYFLKGEFSKSEYYYQRSKAAYEKISNAEGIAKSSRALAKVQEEMHKDKEAIVNYNTAQLNNVKTGDYFGNTLNGNDINRLRKTDSATQRKFLYDNINLSLQKKDTNEVIAGFTRMAAIGLQNNSTNTVVNAYNSAYNLSKNKPEMALRFNQQITDAYLKEKNFSQAIETKQEVLDEPFVQNSTKLKATEITSMADIYIQKKEDSTAIRLLNEAYSLSVKNGHTMEAKRCVEKLDSIFQNAGKKEKSLDLYKQFLGALPAIIDKDSSLTDTRIIEETEGKLKKLETEKAEKDGLIRRKSLLNYWLAGSLLILAGFAVFILYILRKLKRKNRKIALQSLRREMNPHFIFNSLNSINQFISTNNELEANQYLSKFSTLMRRVMENSKSDFVLFSKETELLQNYLELEKSRFPDKFDFKMEVDDALYEDEQLFIPGMLIQPHLENAIWHGLRYMDEKGFLKLVFVKKGNQICITVEDNGIGIAESKKHKTANQQQHKGRGIRNTMERIEILNELYHKNITCSVEDKQAPESGVIVTITVPLLKDMEDEDQNRDR